MSMTLYSYPASNDCRQSSRQPVELGNTTLNALKPSNTVPTPAHHYFHMPVDLPAPTGSVTSRDDSCISAAPIKLSKSLVPELSRKQRKFIFLDWNILLLFLPGPVFRIMPQRSVL